MKVSFSCRRSFQAFRGGRWTDGPYARVGWGRAMAAREDTARVRVRNGGYAITAGCTVKLFIRVPPEGHHVRGSLHWWGQGGASIPEEWRSPWSLGFIGFRTCVGGR